MRRRLLAGVCLSLAVGLCATAVQGAAAASSALAEAARANNAATVAILLHKGANVNGVEGDGMTALHWAVWNGNAALARTLLAHGADVNAETTLARYTPLHLAARTGNGTLVALLIQHGAGVNLTTRTGATPLMLAAASGNVTAVQSLLEAGADPNAKESAHDETALMFAAARDRAAVVKLLLKHGADPNAETRVINLAALSRTGLNPDGRNLPNIGHEMADHKPLVSPAAAKLIAGKTRPYYLNELVYAQGGMTPLLFAARQGYADIVRILLDAGVNVNQVTGGDHTSALLIATINGRFDLGRLLLERGADPNLAAENGATPLYATINLQWAPRAYYPQPRAYLQQKLTYLQYMKLLLDKGANPNARLKKKVWYTSYNSDLSGVDEAGATPFWRAAYGDDVAAMKLLVQHGADPNISTLTPPAFRFGAPTQAYGGGKGASGRPRVDPSGLPPVPTGSPDVTPLLAASGEAYGRSFTANSHRYAPTGMLAAVKYLVDVLHANVNARDAQGNTALDNAAARGDNAMIMFLISRGADVHVLNRNGQTVADMANGPFQRTQPFPKTIALLQSLGVKVMHKCVAC